MRKIDKRSLTSRKNAQNSTSLEADLSAQALAKDEARSKAEAAAKVDQKAKNGKTKLLFQQLLFNQLHSSHNPMHSDSLFYLTSSTGSNN